MTPIEKNVIVVDEQGNTYEATYPKRAKGLVKNGRARFVDETTICLACPPNEKTEDEIMSENKKQETVQKQPKTPAPAATEKYTFAYCMEQIEAILAAQNDGFYTEVLTQLKELSSAGAGDVAGQAKGEALKALIAEREATNRALLNFYQTMALELKPKPNAQQTILEGIERILCNPEVRDNLKMEMVAELMTAL